MAPSLLFSPETGAATLDIIAQYVATIKALREVDPAGVLLNAVGEPIKAYLRQRSVRANVTGTQQLACHPIS